MLRRTLLTKSGMFGVLLIVVGFAGLLPFLGWGLNFEAIIAGFSLIFLRDAITKSDVANLDNAIHRLFGTGRTSEAVKEFLRNALVSRPPATEAEAAEMAERLCYQLENEMVKRVHQEE